MTARQKLIEIAKGCNACKPSLDMLSDENIPTIQTIYKYWPWIQDCIPYYKELIKEYFPGSVIDENGNIDCTECTNCNNCSNCTRCTRCNSCSNCAECSNYTNCSNCTYYC